MRRSIGTLFAVGLFTSSACAGTQETTVEPTSSAPSSEAPGSASTAADAGPLTGSGLVGTFQSAVGANEFDTPVGDWQLMIDDDGVTFVAPDGFEFSPGDVESVTGSEIVFAPDPECPTQDGEATEGRYEWAIEGAELVITEVDDSCRDRAHLLTQAPWQVLP